MRTIAANGVQEARRRRMTAVGASAALLLVLSPLCATALDRSTSRCTLELLPSGTLDGRAEGAPVTDVMRELSRVTGAQVVGLSSADTNRVSFEFHNVPVPEALGRILRNRIYTVLLRSVAGRPQVARVTIVGGSSKPAQWAAADDVPPQGWAPTNEPEASAAGMADPTPLSASERFTPGRDAMERLGALEELNDNGTLNSDALFEVAEVDPDPEIRTRAREILEAESSNDPAMAKRLARLTQ